MDIIFEDESIAAALHEAEIEEHHRPEALSTTESNARMHEIFKLWGIDYA